MRCPFCANTDTQVKDSRPTDELTVVKKSGRRIAFNREKLMASVQVALRKRDVDEDRIERMVSGIARRLESRGENEIQSELIGEMVMDGLRALDEVAYIRFASVYRDFHEAKEFGEIINKLAKDDDAPS